MNEGLGQRPDAFVAKSPDTVWLFVDDLRTPRKGPGRWPIVVDLPEGEEGEIDIRWTVARTGWAALGVLRDPNVRVEMLALDHDLGPESELSGYDVVRKLTEHMLDDPTAHTPDPDNIHAHTSNPDGERYINDAIEDVRRILAQRATS